jgi:hypothetical protein
MMALLTFSNLTNMQILIYLNLLSLKMITLKTCLRESRSLILISNILNLIRSKNGIPAKGYKTRSKKKKSDMYIIERRKK